MKATLASSRATTRAGPTRSSGTASARSRSASRATAPRGRSLRDITPPYPESARSPSSRAARRCSTGSSSPSATTGGRASSGCSGECTSPPPPRRASGAGRPGHLRDLRPPPPRRRVAVRPPLRGAPRAARGARARRRRAGRRPRFHRGDGAAMLARAASRASRASSPSGSAPPTGPATQPRWLKIKNVRGQEIVIGGWVPGKGRREGEIGALLVGYNEGEGEERRLRFAGKVGTGFGEADLRLLRERLEPLAARGQPLRGPPAAEGRDLRRPELSPRSSSPNGPTPGRSATPPTRACATTSRAEDVSARNLLDFFFPGTFRLRRRRARR